MLVEQENKVSPVSSFIFMNAVPTDTAHNGAPGLRGYNQITGALNL